MTTRAVTMANNKAKKDNPYIEFAKKEFLAAGYKPVDEEPEGPNKWIQIAIFELLEVFDKQEHSGFSSGFTIGLFTKLANVNPPNKAQGKIFVILCGFVRANLHPMSS